MYKNTFIKHFLDLPICQEIVILYPTTQTDLFIYLFFWFAGDEVLTIQGKLDGIKTKYAEINSMSDSVLKTLERVLSLSSKLQHTHEDLSAWLKKAEAEISLFAEQEPVGEQLIHSQNRQKARLFMLKKFPNS